MNEAKDQYRMVVKSDNFHIQEMCDARLVAYHDSNQVVCGFT